MGELKSCSNRFTLCQTQKRTIKSPGTIKKISQVQVICPILPLGLIFTIDETHVFYPFQILKFLCLPLQFPFSLEMYLLWIDQARSLCSPFFKTVRKYKIKVSKPFILAQKLVTAIKARSSWRMETLNFIPFKSMNGFKYSPRYHHYFCWSSENASHDYICTLARCSQAGVSKMGGSFCQI